MITILIVLLGGYIVLITQSSYLLDLVNKHCIVRKRGFEIERNSPINNVNKCLSSTLSIADDVILLFQAYNCYDRFFSHYSSTKFSSVMYCIILPYHYYLLLFDSFQITTVLLHMNIGKMFSPSRFR